MKGAWLKTGGIVAGIIGIVVVLALLSNDKQSAGPSDHSSTTFSVVGACDVLTSGRASAAIGNVEAAQTNGDQPFTASGIQITNCGYAHGTENVNDIISVNLQVRSAVNHAGAATNQREFSLLKTSGAQPVSGYGDAAYWVQGEGLHIRSGDNWYMISNNKGQQQGNGTLAISKSVADQIKSKL